MELLRLYLKLIKIGVQSQLQFRTDFLIGVTSIVVLNAINLGTIGILLSQFQSLAGWTIWEIVFLYSVWMLGHSLFSLLFRHVRNLEFYILQGIFDQFLLRPISPFLQLLSRELNYTGIGDVIIGIACLLISMQKLTFQWSIWLWLFLLVVVLSGTLIELAITLVLACLAFWTGRSSAAISTVMRANFMIQKYPLDMFGQGFRIFVTCFLPVAFINYYPAKLLLGKISISEPGAWISYFSPVVAIILLCIAWGIWKQALTHYSSSGG